PAIWIAPPNNSSFSVSVVLPASGWEMMAKVRRRSISSAASDTGTSSAYALAYTECMSGAGMARKRPDGDRTPGLGCLARIIAQYGLIQSARGALQHCQGRARESSCTAAAPPRRSARQGGPMLEYDPSRSALYTPEKHETLFRDGALYSPVQLAIEASRLAYYRWEESSSELQRLTQALGRA